MSKISFITEIEKISYDRITLEKDYCKNFKLANNSEVFISSTVGLRRKKQQDSLAFVADDNHAMFLVADGMGGMSSGERASYIVANTFKDFFETEKFESLDLVDMRIFGEIVKMLIGNCLPDITFNSGTTLALATVLREKTFIVNVGDSRIYSMLNGKTRLETYDHSVAFEKFRPMNQYDRDILRFYEHNNVITNGIIQGNDVSFDIKAIPNNSYDSLCAVTDGVSDILKEREIGETILSNNPAYQLTQMSKTKKRERLEPKAIAFYKDFDFVPFIYHGKDNASAIVYKKKRVR